MSIDTTQQFTYHEGQIAFRHGKPADDNPYVSRQGWNMDRYCWFTGWYDAKFKELLAKEGD